MPPPGYCVVWSTFSPRAPLGLVEGAGPQALAAGRSVEGDLEAHRGGHARPGRLAAALHVAPALAEQDRIHAELLVGQRGHLARHQPLARSRPAPEHLRHVARRHHVDRAPEHRLRHVMADAVERQLHTGGVGVACQGAAGAEGRHRHLGDGAAARQGRRTRHVDGPRARNERHPEQRQAAHGKPTRGGAQHDATQPA